MESITCQTYPKLEIILVDDGSPDNCYEIYNELQYKDCRIHVIQQENRGLSAARNVGLCASNGDFVIFIDSDDYISPYMIEKLVIASTLTNADFSFCNYVTVNEEGHRVETAAFFPDEDYFDGRKVLERICLGEYHWFWSAVWNRLYKREFIMRFRFVEGRIHEDEFHLHEVLLDNPKIQAVKEELYYYRLRNNSIMRKGYSIKNYDRVEALLCRAEDMYQAGFATHVVLCVLMEALGELKKGYGVLDYSTEAIKTRYKSLLQRYRKMVIRCSITSGDIRLRDKIYNLAKTIDPYIIWKIKRWKK